jgi:hypothetical protein
MFLLIRVTVKKQLSNAEKLVGMVVSPEEPKQQNNLYWGYQVMYFIYVQCWYQL